MSSITFSAGLLGSYLQDFLWGVSICVCAQANNREMSNQYANN